MDTDNISTIAVWVYMIISPLLVKYGIDVDQATFSAAFVAIVGLVLAIWSSKNPNTLKFLGNAPEEEEAQDDTEEDAC